MNNAFDFVLPAAEKVSPPPAVAGFIDKVFHEVLPAHFPGYEPREQQVRLAHLVARGLIEGRHVTAEAGTGIGKSLAVLIPAVYHAVVAQGGAVVVSTGTIALQEQYADKDVPFLREVLRDVGVRFTAALAKGKGNYLCLSRLEEFSQAFSFDADEPTRELLAWAEGTSTGDRAELTEEPGSAWQQVCVDDGCTGAKCPLFGNCHYYRARVRWKDANILVCNHKLLLIDIASGGRVLPARSAVILDEAHHLEAEALDVFGVEISNFRVPGLLNEARRQLHSEDQPLIQHAREMNTALFNAVVEAQRGQERARLQPFDQQHARTLIDALSTLTHALGGLSDKADNLADRALTIVEDLLTVLGVDGRDNIAWAEIARPRVPGEPPAKVMLHVTPTDVAGYLRESLFGTDTVVMMSATLAAGGRFDYLRRSVGCPDSLELVAESPFDYQRQAILYVPRDLPDPRSPDFYPRVTPLIEQILLHTDGRAFVLFTSYRGMNEVYKALSGRLRWTVLRQGDKPKTELMREFMTDVHSVLFGVSNGEALSAVIIDKLPFPTPNDPVVEAKCTAIKARGGNDFRDYFLPEAILRLRQGVGRLIRSKSDRGLVAILDSRLVSKGYGRHILDSLPPFRRISSLENVGLFFGGEAR